ncbi:MoaD/ThiS family protein [Clostridium sp. Cult2]|uniref:MoaD/ThiS family protein n=1 Tax=Clostridium sp. Cult2 TaxID=2079003 RepID=UPI001F2AB612|nr:MoaD/ThiS family protein [Clostridium sp. Cult2]MCF6464391.1 molybdopterin synthase sulfur carrier subunit [Clostridium sp. Cult2]
MQIEVRLFATFRNGRWVSKKLSFDKAVDIRYVLNQLQIKEEELGIALINGKYSEVDNILKEGDILALFPPIGGG